MKKRKSFVLILFTLVSLSVFAQSNHLQFKGIPIEGKIDDYVLNLENKGCKIDNDLCVSNKIIVLTGPFAGYENTIIALYGTPISKSIFKVMVLLPEKMSFQELVDEYNSIQEIYIDKYGEPIGSFNFFRSPYSEGDGNELEALKEEKCEYSTFFKLESGYIVIKIAKTKRISITYEDDIQNNLFEKETQKLINDDI